MSVSYFTQAKEASQHNTSPTGSVRILPKVRQPIAGDVTGVRGQLDSDRNPNNGRKRMGAPTNKLHREQSRKGHNEEFVRRLYARRPDLKQQYEQPAAGAQAAPEVVLEGAMDRDGTGLAPPTAWDAVLETIVLKE